MTTFDLTHKAMGNPKSGLFTLYTKIDFSKDVSLAAAEDNIKIFETNAGWLIVDSRHRMPTASTSAGTIDVGTAESGNNIDSDIDADAGLTAWTASDALNAAAVACADGHIWVEAIAAAITDGILEVFLTILAPPNDDDPTS